MRNPICATSMGLIKYAASLDDVHRIAQKGKTGERNNAQYKAHHKVLLYSTKPTAPVQPTTRSVNKNQRVKNKGLEQKVKNFFKMFIDEN